MKIDSKLQKELQIWNKKAQITVWNNFIELGRLKQQVDDNQKALFHLEIAINNLLNRIDELLKKVQS